MKLVFATANRGKLREAAEILAPAGVEVVSPFDLGLTAEEVDVEETGSTFSENSLLKARHLYGLLQTRNLSGLSVFADDSGLAVDALGGAPGIYSARYASLDGFGSDHDFASNIDKLLYKLQGVADRRARFVCVATLIMPKAFSSDTVVKSFEGTCEGRIALERSGSGGFGYDPVFIPDTAGNLSMADLPEDVKNAISHRGAALRRMLSYLTTNRIS